MLSFWPSLSLLVFFLVIFLECRAIAGRVTLPLGSFLMVFCYGSIGAPLLALLLQQIQVDPAAPITWLLGPPIEELAKALPVIVLAFLMRESRRLSIADLTLVGFASGAGFGFVEGNLNALANGALPSLQHLATLGLQTENGAVFFAGHPVSTALVGLAAGIGLRFLPLNIAYACAPSAFVILWASFDHGTYNWKLLNAASTGALPDAHFVVELLHSLTLKGQLATWVLPIGLIGAQLLESYLCSKAVGARRDLLLAREWRPWVINEWLVVLLRAPFGRAVFGQTLAYFRLRRAFFLAAFEARRDLKDPTLSRHARSLEDRLKRERSMLFDPLPGTWFLPLAVLRTYAAQWTWRMRWVLVFAVLLFFVFMLDPGSLPDWLRQFLFGEIFAVAMVIAGLAFAVWRIVLFARLPPPDPLAAEGTAFTSHYTRQLLLGCSLLCGLFPTIALLLGWNAVASGAAFISGYLPGWIGQGGNLQTLLGLGAIGSAVAADPRPPGEAFRHEIAAGDERIRRLGWDIEDKTGADGSASPGAATPPQLDGFLEAMAKLDGERDAQARRQLALDECERQAGEATIRDPAPAVQAVKDEFDRLASELLEAAAKELDAIASLEQAYGRAWSEIMQDLDAHDVLRRRLRIPLRRAWQTQNDIAWALRVVEATDECLLPVQLTLLPELHALATTAQNARANMLTAGVERIREAAAEYGEADPFTFAGADQTDDEAALLAEFASSAPSTETPKAFGLRAPQPAEEPAPSVADKIAAAEAEPPQPAPSSPVQSRGQHYQKALDQLIDTAKRDTRYLETIRHLERSEQSLRQPIEPGDAESQSTDRIATKAAAEDLPAVASSSGHEGELEDLLDAIKRDSGYLDFVKDPQAPQAQDNRGQAEAEDSALKVDDVYAPAVEQAAPDASETPEDEAPTADTGDAADEPLIAATSPGLDSLPTPDEREDSEETISAAADTQAEEQASVETAVPQVAEDARPVTDAAAPQSDDVTAAPEQVDEPASPREDAIPLSASSDDADTGKTEFETSAHAETFDRAEADKPAAVAPHRPTVEDEKPRERDKPPVNDETRSSSFARLFQPIGGQSADSAAKPTRWDDRPQESEAKPVGTEQAQSLATSSIEDRPSAPQPELRDSEPEKSSGEIAAPPPDWLADFASPKAGEATAQADDASLEAIDWPALSQTADDDVPAQKPVQPIESETPESGAADAQLIDSSPVADEAADAAPAAELSPDLTKAVAENATAQPADAADSALVDTSAQILKPDGADEFASKADRLSDLLEKLEQAMQSKAAAPSTPSEEQAAPVADNPAPSTTPVDVASHGGLQTQASEPAITAEPEVREPHRPVEQTPQADQPDESPPLLAEAPAATVEPSTLAEAKPPLSQPSSDEAADATPASTPSAPQEPSEVQLKPDRLSFLLTKLFEAVKREADEQAVKPQQADAERVRNDEMATPADTAQEHAAASEILDLRGPDPIPEPLAEAEPSVPAEKLAEQPPPQERAKVEERPDAPATPDEPVVSPVQLEPAAVDQSAVHGDAAQPAGLPELAKDDAKPAEASEPAASQPEPQPVADTSDVSAAAAPRQPSERPIEPRTKPRSAERAVHFGSRSGPPGLAAPVRALDAEAKPSAPERSPEPGDAATPATTPKRDWKLGSGSPSRGENPKATEFQAEDTGAAKTSETSFRVKLHASGALATVDVSPPSAPASAEKTPGKYYGPRHAIAADDEPDANPPVHRRALSIADALTEHYDKTGQPQPPMYTTDRATLQRIIAHGKLEAPRRRGAPWSISGMSRRGEVVIRLKPGAEQFVEFVPSKELFGQLPHYYPRGVGRGSYATHIPAAHLEYFDVTTRQWAPLQGN